MAGRPLTERCSTASRRWRLSARLTAGYLVCWGITWAFAPSALIRLYAAHFSTTKDLKGNREPITFYANSRFAGQGLDFLPDPMPVDPHWCCVGKPWCPAPFLVTSDVVYTTGPLSAGASRGWFAWTPFGLIYLGEQKRWEA